MMRLWIEPAALKEIATLPGHLRQRVRRAAADLQATPRPPNSRALSVPADLQIDGVEARRLRLDNWRILYLIDTEMSIITIIAIRKRPPYNYDDLHELLSKH
jgi:mRNA interferase RelE/StbE